MYYPDTGGNDCGPRPYELLLSSLGSCTSLTLQLYAERKNIQLKGVEINLTHSKVNREDISLLPSSLEKSSKLIFDKIERQILVFGTLTEDDLSKLLQIADKCPVHKTLEEGCVLVTTLAKA